jgi:RNA 2',3'-cyclic 3'-phosphodiesterase
VVRLFVAVWPDVATRERIAELDLPAPPGVRLIPPERWHITLQFLGTVSPSVVPALRSVLARVASRVPGPLECALGPATSWFDDGRILQLPAAGLDRLAHAVRSATIEVLPSLGSERPYVGHLTLARRRRRPTSSIDANLGGRHLSAVFTVDSVDLVLSERDSKTLSYVPLGSFTLGR